MTFRDPDQILGVAQSTDASGLFARKGDAAPVGGRPALRRTITMRSPARSAPARLTGELMAGTRDAYRNPGQTAAGAPEPAFETLVEPHVEPMILPAAANTPRQAGAPAPASPPPIGPAAGRAKIDPKKRRPAKPDGARRLRGPLRPAQSAARRALKRTTLRLDDALNARLARFADSETLSIQTLLTRALQRVLPAINVQGLAAASLELPSETEVAAAVAEGPRCHRSVRFDPHLYWRLKTAAASRKRSMQSIMIGALMAYLDELATKIWEDGGREMGVPEEGACAGSGLEAGVGVRPVNDTTVARSAVREPRPRLDRVAFGLD